MFAPVQHQNGATVKRINHPLFEAWGIRFPTTPTKLPAAVQRLSDDDQDDAEPDTEDGKLSVGFRE
jgi:hypothetical protein